jgi:uncharacterized membrane protein
MTYLAPTLASVHIGPIQFETPVWLLLIPVCWALALLIGRKSLSGGGTVTRWVSLAIRLIVIALLAGTMAEPQWRKESKDVAMTLVLDASESVPSALQTNVKAFVQTAINQIKKPDDRVGEVTAAKDAFVQSLPSKLTKDLEPQHIGAVDGTNLASALRLAIATAPHDAANRILLATDGNETVGNVLQAAEMAKAMHIPVDVLPIRYKYTDEVLVDRVVSPATAREGETLGVRVVLKSLTDTSGRLTILMNGQPVDLDPDSPAVGAKIDLKAGLNVKMVQVTALRTGPQKFEAIFEPDPKPGGGYKGDTILENNKGVVVTFVAGEGKALVLTENPQDAESLVAALAEAKVKTDVRPVDQAPQTLTELNAFDAVILCNESAYGFTQELQEQLRQYIHDTGGGLVMVGGPNSFGAGGWIGSPLEDALPVRLDPPQKRQMPRGALALVIHSVEAPDGVYLGKKVCEAAVNSLSRLDLAGIIEFGWNGGTSWVHPLSPVGDGTAIKRSIKGLMFGDMPDFTPSLQMAYDKLSVADAGQRHVIMISDGDPAPPPSSLLDKYIAARITISTVGVYPHSGNETSKMQWISQYTGGRHYFVNTDKGLATIPEIFIKEAQTVRRALIREQGGAGFPAITITGADEAMRGLAGVPNINGYVVTGEREGLALVSIKIKADDPNSAVTSDPLLAGWQYGLGKVVAYTSDATTRWNPSWVGWQNYKQFWEQHVRWAMRPAGSANVKVITENKGDSTLITVEALDTKGERLNFANFKGRIATPGGGEGIDVDLKQVGPGRYQGTVPTDKAGVYVMSLRYAAPDESAQGGMVEGSVQAAITRPFADEYRTLEDNTPILTQIAEMTGGRVFGDWDAPGSNLPDLWSREGLTMPVATRSIWLAAAVLGLGLFLMDVAVRRVRIDIPAMYQALLGGFQKSKTRGGEQLGALRSVRDKARKTITERGTTPAGLTPAEAEAQAKAAAKAATATAKVKFEASPEALKKTATSQVALGGADAVAQPLRDRPRPVDAPKQGSAEEGMSRLLKAKQKARGEMEDEQPS